MYTRLRNNASELEQVIAGRVFVVFMVAVSIVWIPIINSSASSQLFVYIQSITAYLAPPICAIYLLAVFWPRANEQVRSSVGLALSYQFLGPAYRACVGSSILTNLDPSSGKPRLWEK